MKHKNLQEMAMSNALTIINNFEDLQKTGEMMARSGLFKDSTDVFKAMVQIQAGQELGVSPFQSMAGIHIIKGKPVLSAGLLAALIKNHPDYDYRVKSHTAHECIVEFYEKNEVVGESSFSMDDAKRAGLLSNPTWNKYPKNMVFSRALSNGAKWYCAGIFGGSVYVEGEIVEAEPVRVVSQSKTRAGNHGGYSSGATGDTETIEGEIVEDEPVRVTHTPHTKSQNNQEPQNSIVDNYVEFARAGNWIKAIEGISRYAGNFPAFMAATNKILTGGVNNAAFTSRSSETPQNRIMLYKCIKHYASQRDSGMGEFDVLKSIHVLLEGKDFANLLKPISTDDFDGIPSAGNAQPTGDQQPLFPEEAGGSNNNAQLI